MTIVTSPFWEMRGIDGSRNKQELCLCRNYTVKILQMLLEDFKKRNSNSNIFKNIRKKVRDTFRN